MSKCKPVPVFSACKAPGSLSPVVESSETGGVKSKESVCCSSRYSRVAQPSVQPPQGRSLPCTAPLLHYNLPYTLNCGRQAPPPLLNTLLPCLWYLLFTQKNLKNKMYDEIKCMFSHLFPSRAVCVSSCNRKKVF